jgi:tetratricopeptide (TPR) repeat protein
MQPSLRLLDRVGAVCESLAGMGIFDRFRSRAQPPTSEQLRQQLFDAVAEHNDALLASLCAEHEAAVLAAFPGWQRVPPEFRSPDKLSWYGPGLIAVAQHFAGRGRPELMRALSGPDDRNPLVEWRRAIEAVDALIAEQRYAEAIPRLRATLDATAGLQGTGADSYRPVTYGRLGDCLFHAGDADAARAPIEQALQLCEASGDADGIVAYLGNLYEAHRYRGDGAAAADCIDRLAAVLDRLDRRPETAHWRRQSAIVRAGEPLCRIVAQLGDGPTCELSDLPAGPGRVRFVFQRNRLSLQPSNAAVAKGTAAAERGELEAALEHFRRAAAADLFDPWPRYHAGMALTELRRYSEAIDSYQATEALAPGWYSCRADRWLVERLAAGAIDHDTFSAVRRIVDGGLAPTDAAARAEAALARCEIGPLYLARGDALAKLRRTGDAADAYRRGLAITDERDVRTCLLVGIAAVTADSTERTRHLHEAIELSGNLVAAAMATVMLASRPAN